MERVMILKESNIGVIKNSAVLFNKIKSFNIDYNQENFIVFFLDTKNVLIKSVNLFKGGLNSCIIDPKTVFRKALVLNANAIIVSHNHPSGDLSPSEEDIDIYRKLQEGGGFLGIKVLDSVIFNKDKFYSMD
jgi:DNA repair protein RadC